MVNAGKDGSVYLDGVRVGYLDNYSLTTDAGTTETSQFEEDWKDYIATSKGWSGSFSGTFDYADAKQKAIIDNLKSANAETRVTLSFKVSNALSLKGNAWISNAQVGASHGDKITISFSFTGDDDLTKACAPPRIILGNNSFTFSAPAGTGVRYTTDGSTPSGSSTLWDGTSSVSISANTTVKAFASLVGYESSDVAIRTAIYNS